MFFPNIDKLLNQPDFPSTLNSIALSSLPRKQHEDDPVCHLQILTHSLSSLNNEIGQPSTVETQVLRKYLANLWF